MPSRLGPRFFKTPATGARIDGAGRAITRTEEKGLTVMDTGTHSVSHRSSAPAEHLRPVPITPALSVSAMYHLSEAGRKASLLSGGDGRARQQLSVQVPTTRLHLVAVDINGVARLKLQPRFELADDQRVVRHDGPPTYDAPPTIEALFKEAARNHELERIYRTERTSSRSHRRDADRERRSQVAQDFLTDPTQRAMVHPSPSATRCFLATASGRLMFDTSTDVGPARELPPEAHRRFRNDLRTRKERNVTLRAEQLALHEEKKRAITEWVATRATDEQRSRHAADVLPMEEVIEALTEDAFFGLKDQPRYERDGSARLQAHLRALTGRVDLVVGLADLKVIGSEASSATSAQWAVVRQLQALVPDADVTLREHRLSWRQNPEMPGLTVFGALVARHVGPFMVRREFAVPER